MPTYREANIVVVGNFNPAIFQPAWLRKHDLLPEYELLNAETTPHALVVASEYAALSFTSLRLEVYRERWILTTERPDWAADLGGLATSILSKLPETPVKAVGFNLSQHRPLRGDLAAVLKKWGPMNALGELAGTDYEPLPCVRARWGAFRVTLQLQPSLRQPRAVWVALNYERTDVPSVEALLQVLAEHWSPTLEHANGVADQVVGEDGAG